MVSVALQPRTRADVLGCGQEEPWHTLPLRRRAPLVKVFDEETARCSRKPRSGYSRCPADRLVRTRKDLMAINDPHDPIATPDPDPTSASPEQPLLIVPATQPPEFTDDLAPTVASPVATAYADETHPPTEAIPVVPVEHPAVVHETYAPAYVSPGVPFEEDRRPGWPYVAAVVALLIGGLAGYFIGTATGDDDETAAPAATVAPAATAQLDEITAIDNARATEELQAQVDLLTAAREDATVLIDQVAVLETALADVTAERDALLIEAGTDDGSATDMQAELDAANATIDELTADLTESNTNLQAANATIAERDAAIKKLQGQFDTANKTLVDLNVKTVPSYINGDIAKARTDAAANGWNLIEQPTVSATSPVGVVLDQAPRANSNMINGSVLYVKVATRS